jgi:DNA-binding response OmpR family regulator
MEQALDASQKLRVLLVEDDPLVRITLTRGFLAAGFAVLGADSIAEGARLAREERPDVAVLDMLLPDGRGVDLARLLGDELHMPFVFLTAYGFKEMRAEAAWTGASRYLVKPAPIASIVQAAQELVRAPRTKQLAH